MGGTAESAENSGPAINLGTDAELFRSHAIEFGVCPRISDQKLPMRGNQDETE
jgi:hypothetical protein